EPQLVVSNITVDRRLAANLPPVLANTSEMEQIFTNLIINARDAMPDGGKLVLTSFRAVDHVEVQVADSGTGMSPEIVERIFDPFFTTKKVGLGTGLGLSLVRNMLRRA